MVSENIISGKTYLITGGSGLIGRSICEEIIDLGAHVISCDINQLDKSDEFLKENERFSSFDIDITTNEGLAALTKMLYKNKNKINGFIHCAYPRSFDWGRGFEDIDLDYINLNLKLQLASSLMLSKIFCEYLISNSGGTLLHISSIQGLGAPKFSHYQGTSMTSPVEYTAIKAGIIAITKWLAKYYANKDIRVNCISPGGVQDEQPLNFQKKYRESCTNIGLLSPSDISNVVTFILSGRSRAINGQNIIVDDGWSL